MLGYKIRYVLVALILAVLQQQQCADADNCKLLKAKDQSIVYDNPSGQKRCAKGKIPKPPDNQAVLIRLKANLDDMLVTLTKIGSINPRYMQCAVYRPETCAVDPQNCKTGHSQATLEEIDSVTVSVASAGRVEISYDFISCSADATNSNVSDVVIWIMMILAAIVFLIVIAMLLERLYNRIRRVSGAKAVETDGDHDLEMVHVEPRQDVASDKRMKQQFQSPNKDVTVFDGPNVNRKADDDDTDSDDSEAPGEQGVIADVTNRLLKQGAEKQVYVDVDAILRKKQEMTSKASDGEEDSDESGDEEGSCDDDDDDDNERAGKSEKKADEPSKNETDDEESEKNSEGQGDDRSSTGGETYKLGDIEEGKAPPPIPPKVEGLETTDNNEDNKCQTKGDVEADKEEEESSEDPPDATDSD